MTTWEDSGVDMSDIRGAASAEGEARMVISGNEGLLSYLDSKDAKPISHVPADHSGALVFSLADANKELIRFEPDGKCYIRGELVDDNKQVYEAFKEFLRQTGVLRE